MKKLMIIAAAAAMTGVASAAECYDGGNCGEAAGATAYTVTLSLKTTAPKTNVKTDTECCTSECSYYNVQKTYKFSGIIWGDAECEGCTMLGDDLSMLIWNSSTKEQADADLALYVGRYDKKGNKVEAYGAFTGDFGTVSVAGFGSLYMKTVKVECEDDECYAYVKSLSGNAAGCLTRPDVDDCEYVTYSCDCGEPIENAAASGTWKVNYNSGVAKKLAKGNEITAAYKIPSYVDADSTNEVIIEE